MYTFLSSLFASSLLLSLQVLLYKAVVVAGAYDEAAAPVSAHFADSKRGRMSWVIDDSSLPWTGQYYYVESSQSTTSNLLVVVDSATGNHLGNCASFAPRDNKWRRFFWILSEDSLICNITDTEPTISKVHFPPSNSPRTFSLRILAQEGPKCFRDMIVQNEKLEGCPPKLKRNSFQEMSLECGCPVPIPETHGSTSAEQSSFKIDARTSAAPFHFINSRISSSAGNSAISHELFPGLLQSSNNAPVITAAPTASPVAEVPTGSILTTTSTTTTEILVPTNEMIPSLPQNPAVEHGTELAPSIVQEPAVPTTTTTAGPLAPVVPELNAQPCANVQCQNNGTCVLGPAGAAACLCPEGFVGSQCEISLCANVQCMHGGVCRTTGNVPRCDCKPGTTGTFCEQMLCNPSCEQGGICALAHGTAVCHCPAGTIGINCNIIDTCSNNVGACAEYGGDARCQLDPNSFALISPVPVNATFKCLCLNEKSEWIDCKQLPARAHISMTVSVAATTTPNVLLLPITGIPESSAAAAAATADTPEQLRASQHIVRLFQHNPHLAHIFPNLIPTIASTTTTVPTVNANFNQTNTSGNETIAPHGLVDLFPAAVPTAAPSPSGTTRIPIFFSASFPPFLITPKPFQFYHLFNITSPEFNETSKPETTSTITAAATGSEHLESALEFVNLTTLTIETATNPTGKGLEELLPGNQSDGKNATALPIPTARIEVSAVPSTVPEFITSDGTVGVTSATNILTFPGPESHATSHIAVSVTMIGTEESSWMPTSTQLNQFTSNTIETEESTSVSGVSRITDGGSLPSDLMSTPSTTIAEEEEKHWGWSGSDHSSTKSIEEMEQTTTAEEFSTESVSTLGEDEVKFVKLTIGLPTTTTPLLPDLEHHPAAGSTGGSTANDTARSGTSSWAIALAVIFSLLVLAGACAMLVLRYVRRSRKLHGKYNPAREESVLSSSYSMPMTTVTKEERLI